MTYILLMAAAGASVSIPNSWVVAGVGAVFFGLTGAITAVYRTLLKSKDDALQREIEAHDSDDAAALARDLANNEAVQHLTEQVRRVGDRLERLEESQGVM